MSIELEQEATIEYQIHFLKGKYKGHQLTVTVYLTNMEEQGLDWYLIQNDYLEEIIPYEEHYRIINRRISIQ